MKLRKLYIAMLATTYALNISAPLSYAEELNQATYVENTETNDVTESPDETPEGVNNNAAITNEENITTLESSEDNDESSIATYNKTIAVDLKAGEVHRFEVFYDKTFPTFTLSSTETSATKISVAEGGISEKVKFTIRHVENISGQSFSVIYMEAIKDGTYTLEYEATENSTLVVVETDVKSTWESDPYERRQKITRTIYDFVGPYTSVDFDTLTSIDYDPLAEEAEALMYEPEKEKIMIPYEYIAGALAIILLIVSAVLIRKKLKEKQNKLDEAAHEDLKKRIASTAKTEEEENEELKEYWESIKDEYETEVNTSFWDTEPIIRETNNDDIYHKKIRVKANK